MKIMIGIAAFVVAAGLLAAFGFQSNKAPKDSGSNVGTRPGGVEKSLDITKANLKPGNDFAIFAAGCFWGVEERFRHIPGVVATAVGYIGGTTKNPTYEQVCNRDTGHAEAVLIEFDTSKIAYAALVDFFFKNHNPTTMNRQGPDYGSQYRSAIFFKDDKQKATASKAIAQLNKSKFDGKIVTEVVKAPEFWMAEAYHQQYSEKNGIAACPIR
ncbi:MAG: peptide-methionine (S)-S-oxide reductase MsrA [Fimbriimonadaceae bacterium]